MLTRVWSNQTTKCILVALNWKRFAQTEEFSVLVCVSVSVSVIADKDRGHCIIRSSMRIPLIGYHLQ